MQNRALSVVAQVADTQIPNYKVAGGLAAAEAFIWAVDYLGWESTSSALQFLCALTAAGMAVNQFGVGNSIQAARNFSMTLFSSANGLIHPQSAEKDQDKVAVVVKKAM